jgi:hypothetical protein
VVGVGVGGALGDARGVGSRGQTGASKRNVAAGLSGAGREISG